MTAHKISVKLGDYEFQAEGSEESVREQFRLFLDAVNSTPSVPKPPVKSPPPPPQGGDENAGATSGSGDPLPDAVPRELLDRAFILDDNGGVSLRFLPRTTNREADTVLALLYGYRVFHEQYDVLSGKLLESAKKSGVTIDRIDRALAPSMAFVTKGGQKSGSRYGLNNQGIHEAEKIVRGLVS